eukprot:9468385-Pyramimonas_sp.AAC.1
MPRPERIGPRGSPSRETLRGPSEHSSPHWWHPGHIIPKTFELTMKPFKTSGLVDPVPVVGPEVPLHTRDVGGVAGGAGG